MSERMGDQFIRVGSAILGAVGFDKALREVALVSWWQRRWRLGFCVLFLPRGYSLSKTRERVGEGR